MASRRTAPVLLAAVVAVMLAAASSAPSVLASYESKACQEAIAHERRRFEPVWLKAIGGKGRHASADNVICSAELRLCYVENVKAASQSFISLMNAAAPQSRKKKDRSGSSTGGSVAPDDGAHAHANATVRRPVQYTSARPQSATKVAQKGLNKANKANKLVTGAKKTTSTAQYATTSSKERQSQQEDEEAARRAYKVFTWVREPLGAAYSGYTEVTHRTTPSQRTNVGKLSCGAGNARYATHTFMRNIRIYS